MSKQAVNLDHSIERDIDQRALRGIIFYLLSWIILGLATDIYQTSPAYFWSIATIYASISISRIIFSIFAEKLRNQHNALWWVFTYIGTLTPAFITSLTFALSIVIPELEETYAYTILTVVAFSSGALVTFSPSKKLMLSYMLTISLPALIILLVNPDSIAKGLMLAIYTLFLISQGLRLNDEYLESQAQKQALKELSIKDGLTGIYNRRHFDDMLESMWYAQYREQKSITAILVDIDHFKAINDTYGHAAGDEVIKHVAQIMVAAFKRSTDVVARIGGEEFAAATINTSGQDISTLAEHLRQEIAAQTFVFEQHKIQLTVSIGISSTVPNEGVLPSQIIQCADEALYRAKTGGRNKVELDINENTCGCKQLKVSGGN